MANEEATHIALAVLRVLLVHVPEEGVQGPLALAREGRRVEGRLLAVDELDEEELPQVARVLEAGRTGQARAEQGHALVAVDGDAPALAGAAALARHDREHVCGAAGVQNRDITYTSALLLYYM